MQIPVWVSQLSLVSCSSSLRWGKGARPWRRPDFTSPRGMHLVFSSCFHQTKTWNQGVRSRVWSAENDSLEEGREVLGWSGCFSYPGADWREEREETHLQNKTNPSGQEGIYGQCHFLSPGYFSSFWLPQNDTIIKTPFWLFFPSRKKIPFFFPFLSSTFCTSNNPGSVPSPLSIYLRKENPLSSIYQRKDMDHLHHGAPDKNTYSRNPL